MSDEHDAIDDDPFLWLEDVTGETSLDWVRQRNAVTLGELTGGERFERLRTEIRQVLDADDRIPFVSRRGSYLYNFWQDAEHPRGLWRRTTLDQYRLAKPAWELLLDVDALAEQEGENWVWHGATTLRPGGYRLALIRLSRGGADASEIREFDVAERRFVEGGFGLPEAKSQVAWIDADRIYVGTDFGPGSLTTSGYARLVKEWRRGTELADAPVVFEGKPDDMGVAAYHDPTEGFERDFVTRAVNFFHSELFVRTADGTLVRVPVPDDAKVDVQREWLLVQLRSPWEAGGTRYPAGALLAARFDAFMAGERDLVQLFEPDAHTSLSYYAWTRDHLILNLLRDVRSELVVLTPAPSGEWQRGSLPGVPRFAQVEIAEADPFDSNEYMLLSDGFTEPGTLSYGTVGGSAAELKQSPAFFDVAGISVRQYFATSADGTSVPYFVVGPTTRPPGPRCSPATAASRSP